MLSEAQTINGLRAVFGEQYPDPVRVIRVRVRVGFRLRVRLRVRLRLTRLANPNPVPAQVRVVAVGGPGIGPMIAAPTTAEWAQYSTEFCGGTHVSNTAEIKSYALITEEGLGKVSLTLTLTLT